MAGLHIVLGSDTRKGPYSVLYVGHSAGEARQAEAKSTLAWFTRLDNPVPVIKHNPNLAANLAAAADEFEAKNAALLAEAEAEAAAKAEAEGSKKKK